MTATQIKETLLGVAIIILLALLVYPAAYPPSSEVRYSVEVWEPNLALYIADLYEELQMVNYEAAILNLRFSTLKNELESKPESTVPSADTIMRSVVHIRAIAGWQGSGAYIGDGLILTAGHVVNGGGTFAVTFENEPNAYISGASYVEPAADVGFIYLGADFNDVNIPALSFSDIACIRGDTAYIYGSPFGWDYNFSVSRGIISSVSRDCNGFFGEKIMLQSDSASYPGNSGGPVTNGAGEIVGILVGGTYGSECISLCIPARICEQARKTYESILAMGRLK